MKTASVSHFLVILALSALVLPALAAESDAKCGQLPTFTQRVECIRSLDTKPSPSSPTSLGSSPASSESVRPAPVARTTPDRMERPIANQSKVQISPARGDGTCHTGPRGGAYTITDSGRKNYSGC